MGHSKCRKGQQEGTKIAKEGISHMEISKKQKNTYPQDPWILCVRFFAAFYVSNGPAMFPKGHSMFRFSGISCSVISYREFEQRSYLRFLTKIFMEIYFGHLAQIASQRDPAQQLLQRTCHGDLAHDLLQRSLQRELAESNLVSLGRNAVWGLLPGYTRIVSFDFVRALQWNVFAPSWKFVSTSNLLCACFAKTVVPTQNIFAAAAWVCTDTSGRTVQILATVVTFKGCTSLTMWQTSWRCW